MLMYGTLNHISILSTTRIHKQIVARCAFNGQHILLWHPTISKQDKKLYCNAKSESSDAREGAQYYHYNAGIAKCVGDLPLFHLCHRGHCWQSGDYGQKEMLMAHGANTILSLWRCNEWTYGRISMGTITIHECYCNAARKGPSLKTSSLLINHAPSIIFLFIFCCFSAYIH